MSAKPLPRDMTADEFLIWNLSQDERYELVDGVPVPLHAMAGASNFHDDVVVSLIVLLGNKLKPPCRPRTGDTALRTAIKRVRRPDVTVDCAPSRLNSYESSNPIAAFEVLSPSTKVIDASLKMAEYQRHPSLRTIVHLDPERIEVAVFQRDASGAWDTGKVLRDASDSIAVGTTGVTLTLAEIYAGITLAVEPSHTDLT